MWNAYCGSDPNCILTAVDPRNKKFPYLDAAFQAHVRRFPDSVTGLTEIESHILRQIQGGGATRISLVSTLLKAENAYGFGDFQYEKTLERLSKLFNVKEEPYCLNIWGKKVLKGEVKFSEVHPKEGYLGGAKWSEYEWNEKLEKCQKV